jgi:hypothetical protein
LRDIGQVLAARRLENQQANRPSDRQSRLIAYAHHHSAARSGTISAVSTVILPLTKSLHACMIRSRLGFAGNSGLG